MRKALTFPSDFYLSNYECGFLSEFPHSIFQSLLLHPPPARLFLFSFGCVRRQFLCDKMRLLKNEHLERICEEISSFSLKIVYVRNPEDELIPPRKIKNYRNDFFDRWWYAVIGWEECISALFPPIYPSLSFMKWHSFFRAYIFSFAICSGVGLFAFVAVEFLSLTIKNQFY